jgi:hypothetical protein
LIRQTGAVAAVALTFMVGQMSASTPILAAESASIQPVIAPDGGGRMVANSQTNPADETWSWEACTLGLKKCSPFAQGRIVDTAGAPIPTVFRVTSSYGATTLSPRWNGRVASVSPPTVTGTVRANELVVPVPGEWRGGWEGDVDWTQLAACKGPHDEGCTTLTDMHFVGGCKNGAAVIDPMFTGMYLRVADWRVSADSAILDYGVGSPYSPHIWSRGQVISTAIVGRIQPATGPAASKCGPLPLVEASISRKGVATVRCKFGCRATLVARQDKRRARISRKLAPLSPTAGQSATKPKLQLRSSQLRGFDPGPVDMIVKADGKRVASRTVNLR